MHELDPSGTGRQHHGTPGRRPPALGRPRSYDQLRRLLEGDLLPRLLLIHNAGPVPPRLAERAAQVLPGAEYHRFLDLVRSRPSDDEVTGFLERLLGRGHSAPVVYTDLIGPTARRLGVLWEEDECDFTEVTLVCSQIQRVIRRLSEQLLATRYDETKGSVLVMGLPSAQHTLGMLLVAEALGQDGWAVVLGPPFQPVDSFQGIDLLAFSMSRTDQWEFGREVVEEARRKGEPHLQVMVGGAAFVKEPHLTTLVGADGWAEDARSVTALADRLCFAAPYVHSQREVI